MQPKHLPISCNLLESTFFAAAKFFEPADDVSARSPNFCFLSLSDAGRSKSSIDPRSIVNRTITTPPHSLTHCRSTTTQYIV